MNKMIEQMLSLHDAETLTDKKNSIKEVIQEITLCGLSRSGFFNTAAFYGGTALRIFYGLDRFSEDLDFTLLSPNINFDLNDYIPVLEKEIRSYGLNFELKEKNKTADSNIRSAFLKGNTKEHILMLFSDSAASSVGKNDMIKIKIEVDTDPPDHAAVERKYQLLPIPYEIAVYDMPSLFAGKIHAVLCRAWKNRVKGRDLYDYVFYLARHVPVNLPHLSARLAQTGSIERSEDLSVSEVRRMLFERFDSIDFEQAKKDVFPFIKNPAALDPWNADFFKEITKNLN